MTLRWRTFEEAAPPPNAALLTALRVYGSPAHPTRRGEFLRWEYHVVRTLSDGLLDPDDEPEGWSLLDLTHWAIIPDPDEGGEHAFIGGAGMSAQGDAPVPGSYVVDRAGNLYVVRDVARTSSHAVDFDQAQVEGLRGRNAGRVSWVRRSLTESDDVRVLPPAMKGEHVFTEGAE